MKNFNNFSDLKKHFDSKKINTETEIQKERKEKFNEVLKGKMHKLGGRFFSVIDGVEHINITTGPVDEKTKETDVLYANVYYKDNKDKERYITFSLFNKDGVIQDEKIPNNLNIKNKYEIYDEVLRLADTIGLGFYKTVDDKLLPPDKKDNEDNEGREKDTLINKEQPIDEKRLEFFRKQKDVITGFSGINSAFRGYYGFVFPKFIVLENEKIGNGAFFKSFEESIKIDVNRFKLPPDQRITQLEFNKIMRNRWKPIANLTKSEFVRFGGSRKIHPDQNDPEWEEKMQVEINKRS